MKRIGTFGTPWHGLIRAGVLTLPNGDTMEIPGNPETDIQYGNTLMVSMPWAYTPERTNEQQQEDGAAGRQWERYAILGGEAFRLLGRRFPDDNTSGSTWLYGAPDQTVWSVTFPTYRSANPAGWNRTNISPTLLFRRFGLIPARSTPTIEYPMGSYAVSQADPPFNSTDGGSVYVGLMDALPDGSKAILAVYYVADEPLDNLRLANVILPVGFWLVTLTGTPGIDLAATFDELKTRHETIGQLDVAEDIAQGSFTLYQHRYEQTGPDEVTHWYEENAGARSYVSRRRRALHDKVLAMWFDESGTPAPLTLTSEYDLIGTFEAESTQSGGPVISVREMGNWQTTSPIAIHSVQRQISTVTLTVAMTYNGSTIIWNATSSSDSAEHRDSSMTFFGYSSGFDGGPGLSTTLDEHTTTPVGSYDYLLSSAALPDTEREAMLQWPPRYYDTDGLPTVIRYSNNALSWGYPDGLDAFSSISHWPCFTPAGSKGGRTTYPAGGRYGSYNPATQELVRGETEPVCWI